MRKAKKLETNLKINYANTMRLIELKDNKKGILTYLVFNKKKGFIIKKFKLVENENSDDGYKLVSYKTIKTDKDTIYETVEKNYELVIASIKVYVEVKTKKLNKIVEALEVVK